MAKQFTLGKNERLKSRKQIEQLFKEGQSFLLYPYKILYKINPFPGTRLTALTPQLQFGIGVGTRNFKKAPDRNRIKRLTREAYRVEKISLKEKLKTFPVSLSIFFIYTGKEVPDQQFVKEKTERIIKKLMMVIDENTVANT